NVPQLGQSEYKFAPGAQNISTDLVVTDLGDRFELRNGRTGIRIRKGADALTLGPIAGVRLPSGAWVGSGQLVLPNKTSSYQARVIARGPVFADIEAAYVISANSFWKLRFRVISNEPVVLVDESFSSDGGASYKLSLNTGFDADQMFWRKGNQAAGSQSISGI